MGNNQPLEIAIRKIMIKRFLSYFALLAIALSQSTCASLRPAFHAAAVGHGILSQVNGFWIMQLNGTPAQRGRAAGQLVGEQVRWLLPRYLKKAAYVDKLSPRQKRRVTDLAAQTPRLYLEQINAYAEAAGVDPTTLLAVNIAPEALAAFGCSCLATTTERSVDGKIRLARNLDWFAGEMLADTGLLVVETGGDHRFASFTWPGVVGVVTGINDAGLAVADLVALHTGANRPRPGMPVLFAVRDLLENSNDVDSALSRLRSMSKTMAHNYALADPKKVQVVESSPMHFQVRRNDGGLAAITNFWDEAAGGARDKRYATMLKLAGDRKLDATELQRILSHVALGEMNVQSLVFEPETRKVYLAQGEPPVAKGSWRILDLRRFLRQQ
jgi:hypothetical protein